MIQLIFETGALSEKLDKIRIIDNMRSEIEKKKIDGEVFSKETLAALSDFPYSDINSIFGICEGEIVKGVRGNDAVNTKIKNVGYSDAYFLNKELEIICYTILDPELEKIGWKDPKNPPDFVLEVFTKLDCMPDEITESL